MPQSSKHIEQLAQELERIVSSSEPIQDLADGFGGAQGPAEGPLWWKEGRYLLFSDIHNNRRMKYGPGKGVSLSQTPLRDRKARCGLPWRRSSNAALIRDLPRPGSPNQHDLAVPGLGASPAPQ